jgi:hypothetical protein
MRQDQDEELDMTSDEALISALTPKRAGEFELKPYSLMRQLLAARLIRDIDEAYFNVIQTVWVCTLEPIEALRAFKDIEGSQLRAVEWAEAHGYSILYYQPLLDIWRQLNRELRVSAQVRVRDSGDGEEPKNDGGPAVP